MARCRCGSGRTYKRCCQKLHQGGVPSTPEALMRSRYCAYALGLVDYIIETTHPEGPHFMGDREAWQAQVQGFCDSTQFKALRVVEATEDQVLFEADLVQSGTNHTMREHSRFVKHDGRWRYWAATG